MNVDKKYAIIGAAGYIAFRHMKAVKETGGEVVLAYDKVDSVGIIDSYFPHSDFVTRKCDFEKACRMLSPDYISICTPNYLHKSQIAMSLKLEANVICEKPLALTPVELDRVEKIEQRSGKNLNTILQLRLHPSIVALKKMVEESNDTVFDVDLAYITSRGRWYYRSWKGNPEKSGGVATNIGIHFYDMLMWVFGSVKKSVVHVSTPDSVSGMLELERARVRYFLSISEQCLPQQALAEDKRTYRALTIDNRLFEFSDGFTDLHTKSYEQILEGRGFTVRDARASVELVHAIRNSQPVGCVGDYHPMAKLIL